MDLSLRRQKRLTTFVVFFANICLGICAAILPPALIEFKDAFGTDMQSISLLITICRYATIGSSSIFTIVLDKFSHGPTTAAVMLIMSLTILIMPHVSNFASFSTLYGVLSIGIGAFVTGQAAWMIDIWKEKATVYIQAQDFFFAVGCIIPAVLFAPFLSDNALNNAELKINTTGRHYNQSSLQRLVAAQQLYIPTLTCGIIVAVGALSLIVVVIAFRKTNQWSTGFDLQSFTKSKVSMNSIRRLSTSSSFEESPKSEDVMKSSGKEIKHHSGKKVAAVVLGVIFVGAFEGIETLVNHYLVVYAKYSKFNLSQARGARILSACNLVYTVARVTGFFTIPRTDPRLMLFVDVLIVATADIWLLGVGSTGNIFFLLAGSIMLEVGFATGIPTFFMYLQNYIEVGGSVAMVLLVGGACVAAGYPAIIGSFIEDFPDALLYFILGNVVLSIISFIIIMTVLRGVKEKL